jgi:hypothetical protein
LRRLATLGLVFVAAILSCGKDVTGPLSSAARYVRGLAFDPVFPPLFQAAGGAGSGLVDFSKVHVVLHHSDGTVALDTTIDFPSGADSLTVELTVKLLDGAPATGEPMSLNLGYINATGDTVFKGGPVSLTAAPPAASGQPNPPVKVPVAYTGPGAAAVAVAISPRSLTVNGGGAFSFSAVAKDALGNILPGAPIIWNTLDPSLATVTSPAAGSGVVGNTRGVARIQAQLLTGATDQVTITIVLPASQLLSQSGNAQTATVGSTLPQPLVVKVAASDGVGVAGTTVNFAVATGGGSVTSASVVSDANGLAQTTWKLGATVGSQSVTASAASLSGSPVTFTAGAQAASATKLVVTTQPANAVAGAALAPIVFTAQDGNGNVATGFTGSVTIAFASNTAGATLLGTASVNAVAGVATFTGLSIAKAGSAYTFDATASGLPGATTNPFDIVPGAPAKLVFSAQPAGGTANLVFSPTIVITATDAFGNSTPAFTGAVTLSFAVNPSGATLLGTATQSAVAGIATFPGVGISLGGTGYQLSASATGLTNATSALFNISGGSAATQLVISQQPTNATAGVAVSPAITVTAKDASNAVVTSFTGSVTLAIGTNPGASTLGGTTSVSAVAGIATFNGITLNKAGAGYTLVATTGALTSAPSSAFNVSPGAAANIAVSTGNNQAALDSTTLALPIAVLVTDANANAVAGVTVNWAAAALNGSTSAASSITGANGIATINWLLGSVIGVQHATATAAGLAGSPLTFTATASSALANKTWTGATSTAYTTATNWSPAGVPVATDSVYVPAGVPNYPLLSVSESVMHLYLASGAALTNNSTLTIGGNLSGNSLLGTGQFALSGTGTLSGAVSGSLSITGGTHTVLGLAGLSVTGNLQIAGGTLVVNGQFVNVGSLTTAGSGTVTMTNAADNFTVNGNATFGGGSETGLLTNGSLTVKGNFAQNGGTTSFVASSPHTTVLFAATAQTVSFNNPTTSNFGRLTFSNTAGIGVLSDIAASGLVTVASGTAVNANSHQWTLTGATLLDNNAVNGISNLATAAYIGAVNPPYSGPGLTAGNVTFAGLTTVVGRTVFNAAVAVNGAGAVLNTGGHTVVVGGAFQTQSGGVLAMITNVNDSLIVNGPAIFAGGSETGQLTTGFLTVAGNFTQVNAGTGSEFNASVGHTTVLTGAGSPSIAMANPDTALGGGCSVTLSCFGNLTISKSGGTVTFGSAAHVVGNLFVNNGVGSILQVSGTLGTPSLITVKGSITTTASSAPIVFTRLGTKGTIAFNAATIVDTLVFAGTAAQTIPAGTYQALVVRGSPTLGGNIVTSSFLDVDSLGVLTVGGKVVTVGGDLLTKHGGQLAMQPGDSVVVAGNANFQGGTGVLAGGVLQIGGNFTQGTAAASFAAASPHVTRLVGATPTITFANPGTSFFGTLQLATAGAVTFATNATTSFDVWLKTGTTPSVTGAGTVSVGRALYDTTGGRWQVTNTTMTGSATLPRKLTTNLTFAAGGILVDSATVTGNVTITGVSTVLGMNGHYMKVTGNFATTTGGVLQMQHANDSLIVKGNASFNGGSTTGQLTNGYFEFDGASFTQGTTATAFAATAPHLTWFWGNTQQTITFGNSGSAASQFGHLYLNDTATVLASNVYIGGQLQSGGQPGFHVEASFGVLLTSNGANLRNVLFDNVRWLLVGTDSVLDMGSVTFSNISNPTQPQFEVQRNGNSSFAAMTNWTFNTLPTSGGTYVKATDTDGISPFLTLTMSGTTPGLTGGFTSALSGAVINGWSNAATWTGGTASTNWQTPGNWSTNAVPTATTDVIIPVTPYTPTTTAAANVHALTVNSGATVSLNGGNLTVNGDLSIVSGGKIDITGNFALLTFGNVAADTVSPGAVTTCNSGQGINLQAGTHTVKGRFCNLTIFGNYTASGPIVVDTIPGSPGTSGVFGIQGAGSNLTIAGNRMYVHALNVGNSGTGTLTMTTATDSVIVSGSAQFNGSASTGLMTAGNLVVLGNITAFNQSLDASGTHTTTVNGASFNTMAWSTAVPGHGYNNLTIKGVGTKQFSGNQWINGTLLLDASMVGPGTLSGSYSIYVNTLVDNAPITGGGLSGSMDLHMTGNSTFTRDTLNVNTVHFDAGGNFILTHNLITNYVVVDSGSGLILNGHTVNLQGNYFTTQNGGVLGMTAAGDSLIANQLFFNGGNEFGALTKGGINVTGPVFGILYQGYTSAHVAVPGASATSFAPSGTRVWFNPSFGANVAFQNPGSGAAGSHFHFVQATNGAPITVMSNVVVDSLLLGESSGDTWQSDSAAQNIVRTITTAGIYNSGTNPLALKAVGIVLNDGTAASTFFNSVTWTNFPTISSGAMFTQNRSSSPPSINFQTYTGASFSGTGNFAFNAGTSPLTLGSSITGGAGLCISAVLSTGAGCH